MSLVLFLLCLLAISAVKSERVKKDDDFQCPLDTEGYYRDGNFPHASFCDSYYNCDDGEVTLHHCQDGHGFIVGSNRAYPCTYYWDVECEDRPNLQPSKGKIPCERMNGIFRHENPGVCNRYYICEQNKAVPQNCPPGLVFDYLGKRICNWPHTVGRENCGVKKELEDGFSCPDGIFLSYTGQPLPHPRFIHDDCRKFYICLNGQDPTIGSCDLGEVFDNTTMHCEYPEYVPGCEDYYRDDPDLARVYDDQDDDGEVDFAVRRDFSQVNVNRDRGVKVNGRTTEERRRPT